MAAQPEIASSRAELSATLDAELRPAAIVLPLRKRDAQGHKLVDETSGDRLGPAHGLILGLSLGAIFWLALGLLAWRIFSL